METDQLTEEELIAFAHEHGCEEVNHWKLERWHKEDVIPRPTVAHLGHGRGTRSLYPIQTKEQLLAACQLLKETRNFAAIRFRLWQEGYAIPLPMLRESIRQLVPLLKWVIPTEEEEKYDAAEMRLDRFLEKWDPQPHNTAEGRLKALLQRMGGRFSRFLVKQFGKKVENLQSFIQVHFYLLHGIPLVFERSYDDPDEPSLGEIMTQGMGFNDVPFLPGDLTADYQRLSTEQMFSTAKMNEALDTAEEADLRRANARTGLINLVFDLFDLTQALPKPLRSLRVDLSDPRFQALALVLFLRLEDGGYAENADQMLALLRTQVPRLRIFEAVALDLRQKIPAVGKEFLTPAELFRRIKNLSETEREQFFASRVERLRALYQKHKEELDAFWKTHPEVESALETAEVSTDR